MSADLITLTRDGLWCERGGFHIDPWGAVERAVTTHAHADHARAGSRRYLASPSGAVVLRSRLGDGVSIEEAPWARRIEIGDATVSLHAAGHVLGSAQVRVEAPGEPVWVITGDYKLDTDPTCEPWEPVRADVFLTESTFGLPIYRWPDQAQVTGEINEWWRANRERERTSLLLAYSLGKAQRVIAGLDAAIGPIGVHGAVEGMCETYRRLGVALPPTVRVNDETRGAIRGGGIVIAPPSAADSPWAMKLAGKGGLSVGMASGWMAIRGRRRWRAIDKGFVLSDHADWKGLNRAVRESGAARVGVTHGYASQFARWLAEMGTESFVVPTRFEGEGEGESEGGTASGGDRA